MGKETPSLDPRLNPIIESVYQRLTEPIAAALGDSGLADEIGLTQGLTFNGIDLMIEGLRRGMERSLTGPHIHLPDTPIEEIGLTKHFVDNFGLPTITHKDNTVTIQFNGPHPLVQEIIFPLNPALCPPGVEKVKVVTNNTPFFYVTPNDPLFKKID